MNNKSKIFYFLAGVATGSAATFVILKDRYDKMYEESVESVKESFEKRYSNDVPVNKEESKPIVPEKPPIVNYAKMVNDYNTESIGERETPKGPYVVTEEEFDDNADYNVYICHYLSDGVLVDDCYDKIENVEETVGVDFPNHFDNDCVYVRNDERECDYEILLENRSYAEVRAEMPPTMED